MIRSQYSRILYAANFGELLSGRIEDTTKPPPMPVGPYLALVTKYETGESRDKKTPYVRFFFRILQPRDGVDMQQLEAVGDYSEKQFRSDFYTTKDAMWRFRDFIEKHLKIEVTGGRTYAQALPETTGKQVIIHLKQSPSSRPGDDSIFNEIESIQAAE